MRYGFGVILAATLGLAACDQSTSVDAGGADAGGIDGGGASAPFTYAVVLEGADDFGASLGPLAGARVAVDTDVGRFSAVTDAEGRASVEAEATDGQFDVLFAADGYVVDGEVRRSVAAIPAAAETVVLPRLGSEVARVSVRGDATGIPAGGRWCFSAAPWFVQCASAASITVALPPDLVTPRYVAFALDADDDVVEVVTGDTVEGDPVTASVAFDGTSELTLTSREIRVQLPTDPASLFGDHAVLPDFSGWLSAADAELLLIRGLVTHVTEASGNALTATFWEARADGESLFYANAAYPAAHERGSVRVYRWYSTSPPDEMSFLDVPRPLSEGMALDAPIGWTAVDGADSYGIVVEVGDRLVARVRTATAAPFVFPALPEGFDASGVFPPGEEWAVMRPVAVTGTLPSRGDYAVDGQLARGPAFSLMR